MMRLLLLLASSSLLTDCASMHLNPFKAGVTLPYSEDCFFKNVLTPEEERIPKPQCEELKKRSIILTSDSWKILREDIQNNCQVLECKQIVGQFDQLFLTIDESLQKIP